ncbi:MAG: HigA family addiction module antidote protein [Candidatus Symbiothrix sp.]|jgi:addiction module HigA family antidote|nr:HigA family addiction module antidote protein [Candidatus Symbiothrix sp.]
MGNLVCARPIHPGEVLKDEIECRGISQIKLSAQMGMSYKVLNDILNERRPLTTTTAMLFEAAMGLPADALMRMQLKYNMQIAKQDKTLAKRLAEIRKIAALL